MTATSWEALDVSLTEASDEIAPDGSQVRVLSRVPRGSMGHFTIPSHQIIRAVRHKTVDEIWFVLEGEGEMWREKDGQSSLTKIKPCDSLVIPVGVTFQVRSSSGSDLCVLGQTMPAWPNNDEAEYVDGPWKPTLIGEGRFF